MQTLSKRAVTEVGNNSKKAASSVVSTTEVLFMAMMRWRETRYITEDASEKKHNGGAKAPPSPSTVQGGEEKGSVMPPFPLEPQQRQDVERALGARRAAVDPLTKVAQAIEKAIHRRSTTHEDYVASVVRMIFALSHNRNRIMGLVQKTSADEVVAMGDAELLVGTGVARAQEQLDDREHRFRSMLQEKFEELTDKGRHEEGEGLLKCARCHSTNVIWDQRQTRSADEGMTIIAQCLSCNNAWSMS